MGIPKKHAIFIISILIIISLNSIYLKINCACWKVTLLIYFLQALNLSFCFIHFYAWRSMDGWMDGRMEGRMDRWKNRLNDDEARCVMCMFDDVLGMRVTPNSSIIFPGSSCIHSTWALRYNLPFGKRIFPNYVELNILLESNSPALAMNSHWQNLPAQIFTTLHFSAMFKCSRK